MTDTRRSAGVLQHPIGARGEFALRIHAGEVDVRATDGDVVTVEALDGRDLEEQFVIERTDGRLVMHPHDRVMLDLGSVRKGGAARLAVDVPRLAQASIETASGQVRVDGLTGEQRYRTASGEILLSAVAGALSVDAVSGSVQIDAAGAVDLSGRLVSGDLTVNGGTLRTVALATTSGDIALGAPFDGPGPFSIQTVSGDVEVMAGPAGLRIEARTVTGQVSSELGGSRGTRGRGEVVVGSGNLTLTFRSISGDLRVASGPATGAVVSHTAPVPPAAPPPPVPASPDLGATDVDPDPRLAVLRDLESGVIDVETATARLAALEETDDV